MEVAPAILSAPCPFCGEAQAVMVEEFVGVEPRVWVECMSCRARTRYFLVDVFGTREECLVAAEQAWNVRSPA